MDKMQDVAVIVGSLRKDSINRKVANALAELAPAGLKLSIIEIGQLPIYNQDGDENPPAESLPSRLPAIFPPFQHRCRGFLRASTSCIQSDGDSFRGMNTLISVGIIWKVAAPEDKSQDGEQISILCRHSDYSGL